MSEIEVPAFVPANDAAGDKPEPLVHDVTLLPRHAPSCEGPKCHPCVRNTVLPMSQEGQSIT